MAVCSGKIERNAATKRERSPVARKAVMDRTTETEGDNVASVSEGEQVVVPPAGYSGLEGKALHC